jgi:ABC-2 type transport system permease protein
MRALAATIFKELLLLSRDRTGLLVLFLMPAVLVIVISLVQENILKTTGETQTRMLFINHDQQDLGKLIEDQMVKSGHVEIIKSLNGVAVDEKTAKKLLSDGKYQFCIIIPEGLTEKVKYRAIREITASFQPDKNAVEKDRQLPDLTIYFDPMVHGAFRSAVVNALHNVILMLEIQIKAGVIAEILPVQMNNLFQNYMGPDISGASDVIFPRINTNWANQRLMDIQSLSASSEGNAKLPTSVQQNVPAWALFGMFFIVIPLGGSIIRERQNGVFVRLMTLPVSYIILLLGKVIACVVVCLFQFSIILMVGIWVMPLLGTPTLQIGSSPLAILAVVVSASLAAAGYGVFLGTAGKTYEQVSMFGAVSVVIAAALGGIMVPVYVMPKTMQYISHFSPLAWGLNSLTDIFAREGNIRSVFPEILYLLSFFAGTMLTSWIIFLQKNLKRG